MDVRDLVLYHAPGNLFWKDKNLRYLGCNAQFAHVAMRKSVDELIGKTDIELFLDSGMLTAEQLEKINNNDRYVLETGKRLTIEEVAIDMNGDQAVYLTTKSPLVDDDGHVIGLVGTSLDITEQKNAENVKRSFIENMSHDLRTPLSGIIGLAEVLSMTLQDNPQKNYAEDILGASNQLYTLINEILDLTSNDNHAEDLSSRVFSPVALLKKINLLFQPSFNKSCLTFLFEVDESVPEKIKGNHFAIHRVLLNLIGNALKFTREGYVKLSASVEDRKENNLMLVLDVEDTGIGIPKKELNNIFSQFVRLHASSRGIYEGTGVGLHLVKRIIEKIGGTISVESELHKGSLFTCKLPMQSVAAEVPGTDEINQSESDLHCNEKQTLSVLLVDDNELIQKVNSILFSDAGWKIDLAMTGMEAIEKVKNCSYDLVMMDIGLPDKDGYDVVRELHHWADEIDHILPKFVALSAHSQQEIQQQCDVLSVTKVLQKPLSSNDIPSLIKLCQK